MQETSIRICFKKSELGKILDIAGIRLGQEKPKLLADAILHLLNNPELMKKLGGQGRKYILENHEKEKVLNKFFKKIENLLSS